MIPKVSVCIPVYNGEEYLKCCMNSLQHQTFRDFEIIVIDDCSTDSSYELAASYIENCSNLRVVKNTQNNGLVQNWNRCVDVANGEWIKFLFQDDWLEPTCLEKLVSACSAGDSAVVCGRTYIFDGVSHEVKAEYLEYQERLNLDAIFDGKTRLTADDIAFAAAKHVGINFIGEPTSILIRKNVFQQMGLFNSNFVHLCDFEYWIRVASNTGLVYVPEKLVNFRVHSSSTSAANRDRRYYCSEVLDPLLLLHEYAYNPFFARVRKMAKMTTPPLDLAECIGKKAFWAYSMAKRPANIDTMQQERLQEWYEVSQKFPRIINMHFRWLLLKNFLTKHFFWRLGSSIPGQQNSE